MAEPAGTLDTVVFDDAALADNSPFATGGTGPGEGNGSAAPMEGQGQPALSALEARLAELERTNSRHKDQIAGSQQEAQRLVEQPKLLSQQNTDLLTTFRDLLKTPGTAGNGTATSAPPSHVEPSLPPQGLNLTAALQKANLEGDYSEVARLETQLTTLVNGLTTRTPEGLRPEQIQELVRKELTQSTTQQQGYQRMVSAMAQRHPFLADPKDPLYAEVWQAYDEARANPFTTTVYGDESPRYTVDMPAPAGQGFGTKPMDMRVLNDIALEVKAKYAATNARQQDKDRRDAPTLDATGRQPPSSRTPSMLFLKGEIANMQELLRLGIRGIKTMDEFRRYRWDKLIAPDEKQRRLELWRAGRWES